MRIYRDFLKRIFDFFLAIILSIASMPLFLVTLILISIVTRENPFFLQARPGKNGKIFKVVKFKTMNERRDLEGNLLPDIERITPIGKFIRELSLDELPQLLNVLKGDMSLVGPRPLLTEYLLVYNDFQKRRHEVRPGISGLAQVKGRNALSWEEKFQLDIWYVDHLSFKLDLKILWLTVLVVTKRKGISKPGEATMTIFTGSPSKS